MNPLLRRLLTVTPAGAATSLALGLLLAGCGGDSSGTGDAADGSGEGLRPLPKGPAAWQVGPKNGRWVEAREGSSLNRDDLSDEERKELERLEAIGYVQGKVRGGDRAFVTLYVPEETAPGPILLTPAHAARAYLIPSDWKGDPQKPLHTWHKSWKEAFPDRPMPKGNKNVSYWRRTALMPDGGLTAIFEGYGIIRLDKDSNLLWANPIGAHHDLEVMPDGSTWVLTRVAGKVPAIDPERPVLQDFVTLLDPDGQVVRSISVLKAYHESRWAPDWSKVVWNAKGDILHTNTLHRLDGRHADKVPEFQEGRFLLSSPMLNTIFVLDVEEEKLVWAMDGRFSFQHDPQVLDNGNLMLFDNMWSERTDPDETKASSIQEIDPATGEVVWRYDGNQVTPFYSQTCGAAQRLPNGNTLITETDYGRAFEVDATGKLVWEFVNPFRAGDDLEFVACLMEAWRVTPDIPLDWLDQ